PLQVAQETSRTDPVHAGHGGRLRADPRRESVREPPQHRRTAKGGPERRKRRADEGRRKELGEVVDDLGARTLVREPPGKRLGGARGAGAVRRGEDQDAGAPLYAPKLPVLGSCPRHRSRPSGHQGSSTPECLAADVLTTAAIRDKSR